MEDAASQILTCHFNIKRTVCICCLITIVDIKLFVVIKMYNNDCNLPLYIANRSFYDRFTNNFSIPKSRDLDVDNPGIQD